MKRLIVIILIAMMLLPSCKTTEQPKPNGKTEIIERIEKEDDYVPWWLKSK